MTHIAEEQQKSWIWESTASSGCPSLFLGGKQGQQSSWEHCRWCLLFTPYMQALQVSVGWSPSPPVALGLGMPKCSGAPCTCTAPTEVLETGDGIVARCVRLVPRDILTHSVGQVVKKQMQPTMAFFFSYSCTLNKSGMGTVKSMSLTQGLGCKRIASPYLKAFEFQLRHTCFSQTSFGEKNQWAVNIQHRKLNANT